MTANNNFKRRVRARAARTGESYTAALRHLRSRQGATVSETTTTPAGASTDRRLRLAVAQTTNREDPGDADGFRAAGIEIRDLMSTARSAGADLVQFCEATLCFPAKRRLSRDPERMAEADWSRFAWGALESELAAIAEHAAALRLWTVVGCQHRSGTAGTTVPTDAAPAVRPTTGPAVIAPDGRVAARYDERVLSHTKERFMYGAGTDPVTVRVNGVRIGLTSGLEVHFPELFTGYETAGVDVVLFSTAGPGDARHAQVFADEAKAHASVHQQWIGFAGPSITAPAAPSGVIDPSGTWVARGPAADRPAVVTADVVVDEDNPARAWRRSIRNSHPALHHA